MQKRFLNPTNQQQHQYRGKSTDAARRHRTESVQEHPDRNRARTEPQKLQRIKQRLQSEHSRGLKVEVIGGAPPPTSTRHQSASPHRAHFAYRGQQRRARRVGKGGNAQNVQNGKLSVIRNDTHFGGGVDDEYGAANREPVWPLFEANMSLKELSRVRAADTVDFRRDDGKSVAMEVVEQRAPSHLLLRPLRRSARRRRVWCDYHIEMYRLAEWQSITRRPVTREEMARCRVGDEVDVNPYHTPSRGWTLGVIAAFDGGQAQVRMARPHERSGYELYWVHLDNPMEAAPPGTYSEVDRVVNGKRKHFGAELEYDGHRTTMRRRSKSNVNGNGHRDGQKSTERGRRGSSYPEAQRVRKRSFGIKVAPESNGHSDHRDDELNGYRSPFHELQQNPNSKLKLLPQDSNASETAGFVMVNYPTTELDENEDRKMLPPAQSNLDSLDEDLIDHSNGNDDVDHKRYRQRPRGRRQRSQSKQIEVDVEHRGRRLKRPHSTSFREDRHKTRDVAAEEVMDGAVEYDDFGGTLHHSKRGGAVDAAAHRPVIQFGGAMTDKEVQYVLKRLSGSGPPRRSKMEYKGKRHHNGYHLEHGLDGTVQNGHHFSDDEQQRRGSDLRNQSRRRKAGRPDLSNRYSNTAPSTPLGVSKPAKNGNGGHRHKSKRDRSRKHRERRRRSKSRRTRDHGPSAMSFQTDMV